jgi:hypothetical protein
VGREEPESVVGGRSCGKENESGGMISRGLRAGG